MAGVGVTFGATDTGLVKKNEEVARSAGKMTEAYKKGAREVRQWERAALKALSGADSHTRRYMHTVRGLNMMVAKGKITEEQRLAAMMRTRAEITRQNSMFLKFGSTLGRMAQGYLGIAAAIGAATGAYNTFLTNLREHEKLTRDVIDSSLNFALLQPAGTVRQRRRQVGALGVSQGFFKTEEEQSKLFDLVQSIQSQLGGAGVDPKKLFPETLKVSEAVLQARQVGIPMDVARELATQAIAQGQEDRTSFIRFGLKAGQLSERTAGQVGQAAPELQLFKDKPFAFAIAAKIADVAPEQIRSWTKNTAKALQVSADREKLGLPPDASAQQVLAELAARNITTLPQLKEFGISDIRAQQSVAVLAKNYAEVARETELIRAADMPGMLKQMRTELEREDPIFFRRQENRRLESEFAFRRAFDDQALVDENRRRRGALRGLGRGAEQMGPFDLASETGDVTPFQRAMGRLNELFDMATGGATRDPERVILQEEANRLLEENNRLLGAGGGVPAQPENGGGG